MNEADGNIEAFRETMRVAQEDAGMIFYICLPVVCLAPFVCDCVIILFIEYDDKYIRRLKQDYERLKASKEEYKKRVGRCNREIDDLKKRLQSRDREIDGLKRDLRDARNENASLSAFLSCLYFLFSFFDSLFVL